MFNKQNISVVLSFLFFLVGQMSVEAGTKDIYISTPGYQIERYNLGQANHYKFGKGYSVDLATYQEKWHITTSQSLQSKSGDVDGNGEVDVVYTDGSALVAVDGSGDEILRMITSASLAMLGDVNGDDDAEIFLYKAISNTGHIYVYDGDGTLIKHFTSDITPKYSGYSTELVPASIFDVDGDGDLELLAYKNAGYSAQPRGVVLFDYNTASELWYYGVGPFVRYLCAADITGDGVREIIFGSGGPANGVTGSDGTSDSRCYTWCLGGVTKTRLWGNQYEGSGFVDSSVNVADINGDGVNEVIATSYSHGWDKWSGSLGRVYILNPSNGNIILKERNFSRPVKVGGLADLNRDGRIEILVEEIDSGAQKGRVLSLDHNLNTLHSFTPSQNDICNVQVIADVGGDRDLEVIVMTGDMLYILDDNLIEKWRLTLPPNARSSYVSDLNGDGALEIIVLAANELYVYSPSLSALDFNLRLTVGKTKAFLEWNPHAGNGDYRYVVEVWKYAGGWQFHKRIEEDGEEYLVSPRCIVEDLETNRQYKFRVSTVKESNGAVVGVSGDIYGRTDYGPEIEAPVNPIVLIPGVGSVLNNKETKTRFDELIKKFNELGWENAQPATVTYSAGNYFSGSPYPTGIKWKLGEEPSDYSSPSVFTFFPYDPRGDYPDKHEKGITQKGIELGYFLQHLGFKGRGDIQLIGHSLGGLTARSYLQRQVEPMSYRDNVVRLVTTGSPHNGVIGDHSVYESKDYYGVKDIILNGYYADEWRNDAFLNCLSPLFWIDEMKIGAYINLVIAYLELTGWDFKGQTLTNDVLYDSASFLHDLNTYQKIQKYTDLPNIHYVSIVNEIYLDLNLSYLFSLDTILVGLNDYLGYPAGDGFVSTESQNLNTVSKQLPAQREARVIKRRENHKDEGNDHIGILMALDYPMFSVKAECPVDLEVTAPSGKYIAKGDTAIFLATYNEIWEEGQETPHDIVEIPFPEVGGYNIKVIPTEDADPNDTFTLIVGRNGEGTIIIDNGTIGGINSNGYDVINLDIMTSSINLKSKGRTPVTIITTPASDATTIDPASVRFAGAAPVHYSREDADGDGDIDLKLHFMTAGLNIKPADREAILTGQAYDGVPVVGMTPIKVVPR